MQKDPAHSRRGPLFALGLAAFFLVMDRPGINFCAQPQTEGARLIYTKVLKGSVPEYVRIEVDADGGGTYDGRKLAAPPHPRKMKLSSEVSGQLFALAASLGDFQSIDLDSHKRVANLGLKSFAYENGLVSYKTEFNYTLNRTAQKLTNLFEGISSVEQHLGALEYSARYDPLGLPHELLLIEIDLDNNALADPQLMAPILERITKDSRYMHLAQVRAQDILQRIQNN